MNEHIQEKILNIGIIWSNPYSANKGVAALTYSILYLLKTIEVDNHYKFNILLVGSGREGFDEIQLLNGNIKYLNTRRKKFLTFKGMMKFFVMPQKSHFIDILKLDFVLDLSEGDSYSDIYGKERFNLFNNSKRFFCMLNKKQLLLPQTIGPFDEKKLEIKAINTLSKIEYICVRDKLSYNYVKKNVACANLIESIDLAFLLPYKRNYEKNGVTKVGINISGLLWGGGYTNNNQFLLNVNYQELIINIINYFYNLNNIQIFLVGHVFDHKREIENDLFVNNQIHLKYPKTIIAPEFVDPIEAKSFISNLDFFIGSRMHACIAAFSAEVPVVPLAYSRKFNGLFADTLNYHYLGDCKKNSIEEIIQKVHEAFNNKELLKDLIKKSNKEIVKPRLDELEQTISRFLDLKNKQNTI